jgi:hypothetical protein
MLENTEEPIKNGKSKKISNIRPNTKTNKATAQYVLDYLRYLCLFSIVVRFVITSSGLVACRRSYLRYLCLFAYSGVQHVLCCRFVCLRVGSDIANFLSNDEPDHYT